MDIEAGHFLCESDTPRVMGEVPAVILLFK